VFAQAPSIEHRPVACATAEKFPRLEAGFSPADTVATAKVVFQGQTTDWYAVAMKREGALFAGVLPKPRKDLKSFRYYIEVTDKAMGTSRTPEYTAAVVDSASACKGKVMAAALGSASVILQGPAGIAAIPAGFAPAGVVAGSAAGSGTVAGAAGASGAGAGGGIGATALVLGGVAVVGGAVAVGASKGGNDSESGSSSPGTTGSGNVGAVYNVIFLPSPPGIDVSVCAGRSLTWGSQALSGVDAGGNFNMTWAPNEPNTLRISGQLTATGFQATLACVSGAQTGSISASGSNFSYTGTFTFGNSRGQVSITKQ
jgi:hypothetical protein